VDEGLGVFEGLGELKSVIGLFRELFTTSLFEIKDD
jgi:hypothetical protein